MARMQGYAIGQQSFEDLRKAGAVYVDKTMFVDRLVRGASQYIFLARPRRFGKSLLLSTIKCLFQGKRELFKGLYIDSTDWEWETHPVLHLDLNIGKYEERGKLEVRLDAQFRIWEDKYGIADKADNPEERFGEIIRKAHLVTGRQVVILVDEYDKPLVSNLKNKELLEYYSSQLAAVYSNLKSSAEHIRLAMLTGVSRFSKLTIFSGLNNLKDISFSDEYADICGITEHELRANFKDGIQMLADKYGQTPEEILMALKDNYDGYRFAEMGSDIYNPWSILNAMDNVRILNYWNMTGIPTIVAEKLRNTDVDLDEILNTDCSLNTLMGFDLLKTDPISLLYQAGYLTIKDYDPEVDVFRLGIPNKEVKEAFYTTLIPFYTGIEEDNSMKWTQDMRVALTRGDAERFMKLLQAYFAGINYELKMGNENNFQSAVYILVSLIGLNAKAEEHTSAGRIDLLVETGKFIYIIEFKFNGTAQEAMNQINEKGYALKFAADPRRIIKIGANFNSKTRTLDTPLIELYKNN